MSSSGGARTPKTEEWEEGSVPSPGNTRALWGLWAWEAVLHGSRLRWGARPNPASHRAKATALLRGRGSLGHPVSHVWVSDVP